MSLEKKSNYLDLWCNASLVWKRNLTNRSLRTIDQYRFLVVLVEFLRELSLNMF
jgi:hypothetical protein